MTKTIAEHEAELETRRQCLQQLHEAKTKLTEEALIVEFQVRSMRSNLIIAKERGLTEFDAGLFP
jgi:hypothetical protein